MSYKVPVGLSNKHIHLTQEHLDILFGAGSELHPEKWLKQPGQYGSYEKVEVVGPKGTLKNVRILGPLRKASQLEISLTDARQIGIKAPIRESGDIEGTPGIKIVGPAGELQLEKGVIVASRHIHLSTEQAKEAGVVDKEIVKVQCPGERALVFENVLCRVSDAFVAEMHVDLDEGNAAQLENGQLLEIIK
ncbi:MAG: phosphate propanoyltransferase [Clostridiales bacterium]|nr:phosphate propanoyltransferase [Clostridiales bacterium]MBQ3107179.1 phosphate propanoyltransferase [Bacillota bacterium]